MTCLSPYWDARTELVQRLLADTCELCGSHADIEVHHIRALKDLKRYGRPEKPAWVKTMAARHRKTLVVCRSCHKDIHQGQPLETPPSLERCMAGEPDELKGSSPVRRGRATRSCMNSCGSRIQRHLTWGSAPSTLPGHAARVISRCEALGTMDASLIRAVVNP